MFFRYVMFTFICRQPPPVKSFDPHIHQCNDKPSYSFFCPKRNNNKCKYKTKQQNRKKENRIYNANYITTSLSGSTWNHWLFYCLLSPKVFNSIFHGTDASYIQTLSPQRSFSVSRIHGGHPSNVRNFDTTPPLSRPIDGVVQPASSALWSFI